MVKNVERNKSHLNGQCTPCTYTRTNKFVISLETLRFERVRGHSRETDGGVKMFNMVDTITVVYDRVRDRPDGIKRILAAPRPRTRLRETRASGRERTFRETFDRNYVNRRAGRTKRSDGNRRPKSIIIIKRFSPFWKFFLFAARDSNKTNRNRSRKQWRQQFVLNVVVQGHVRRHAIFSHYQDRRRRQS